MPSWQVFQIGIWLRISRAWRILKKFGKFSGEIWRFLKYCDRRKIQSQYLVSKNQQKPLAKKSYNGILLCLRSFDTALLIGVWVCRFSIIVTLKSVAE
jgi:hypothetical protein